MAGEGLFSRKLPARAEIEPIIDCYSLTLSRSLQEQDARAHTHANTRKHTLRYMHALALRTSNYSVTEKGFGMSFFLSFFLSFAMSIHDLIDGAILHV